MASCRFCRSTCFSLGILMGVLSVCAAIVDAMDLPAMLWI